MGKQKGIITLQGTVGNITFMEGDNGISAREKSYKRTGEMPPRVRENNAEFQRAGKATGLVRRALALYLKDVVDRRMTGRLVKVMSAIVKSDPISRRGERNVLNGKIELLEKFEFNSRSALHSVFPPKPLFAIDRVAGTASISIPAFLPDKNVNVPPGTTHIRLFAVGAEIDFETGEFKVDKKQHPDIAITPQETPGFSWDLALTPNATDPWFLIMGIQFYQNVNGEVYSLDDGVFNALAVVKVDAGA